MTFVVIFMVILLAIPLWKIAKCLKAKKASEQALRAKRNNVLVVRGEFNAVRDLIEAYRDDTDPSRGVERLKKIFHICFRVDDAHESFMGRDKSVELNARFCLRSIAILEYRILCQTLDKIQNEGFLVERRLKELLPQCREIDEQMAEFYGENLPEGFNRLEPLVRSTLDSGDIGAYVNV